MKAQRLRFRYRLTADAATLRHRDIVDAWGAAVMAGGLALSHSEGKRPGALISLAAPLPQGVTSDWELVDIILDERADPGAALAAVKPNLPPGLEAIGVTEHGVSGTSLQSALRWAEYVAVLPPGGMPPGDVQAAVDRLLAADKVPAVYKRENKTREYDLRPLVLALRLECAADGPIALRMKLRAEPEATGRADQVVLALGLPEAVSVHRTQLYVEEVPAVISAYRRAGEE